MIRSERYQGGSYKGTVLIEGKYPSYALCGRVRTACYSQSSDRDQGSRNADCRTAGRDATHCDRCPVPHEDADPLLHVC